MWGTTLVPALLPTPTNHVAVPALRTQGVRLGLGTALRTRASSKTRRMVALF